MVDLWYTNIIYELMRMFCIGFLVKIKKNWLLYITKQNECEQFKFEDSQPKLFRFFIYKYYELALIFCFFFVSQFYLSCTLLIGTAPFDVPPGIPFCIHLLPCGSNSNTSVEPDYLN